MGLLDEQVKRILIVDDDAEIRELLGTYMGKNGFEVRSLADGSGLIDAINGDSKIDLVILDVMMPGEDGFTLCRKVREISAIPIIMLTASIEDTDRIVGLELGADDYVAKPFNPRELLARVKAVLRRTPVEHIALTPSIRYLCFDNWKLDTVNRDLIDRFGKVIPLSGADYQLLELFLENPNKVLSRDDLTFRLHGRESSSFGRGIDVQLSRLRQRLGDEAKEPRIIKTVRGQGYVLALEVERKA